MPYWFIFIYLVYYCIATSFSTIQKLQNRIPRFLTSKYNYLIYSSSILRNDSDRYEYSASILIYNCVNNPNDNTVSFSYFPKAYIIMKPEKHKIKTLLYINL